MTQFVFKGDYKEYRGYVFAHGKPVTIKDEGTDRLLRNHPEFEIYTAETMPLTAANRHEAPLTAETIKRRGRPPKGQ